VPLNEVFTLPSEFLSRDDQAEATAGRDAARRLSRHTRVIAEGLEPSAFTSVLKDTFSYTPAPRLTPGPKYIISA